MSLYKTFFFFNKDINYYEALFYASIFLGCECISTVHEVQAGIPEHVLAAEPPWPECLLFPENYILIHLF